MIRKKTMLKWLEAGDFVINRFKQNIALAAFAVAFGAAAPSYAACSSPAANEGAIAHFTSDDKYKLCDGTNWQNLFLDDPLAPFVHLDFNEGSGATANDTGISGLHDGTLLNAPAWEVGALRFTSTSSQEVTIPTLLVAPPLTHSIWIKKTGGSTNWFCVVCEDGDSGIWFMPASNDLGVYQSAGGSDIMSVSSLTLNAWHHIVVTDDGTTSRLYHNGTQVDTSASRVDFSVNSFGAAGGMYYFHGLIDDYRLYNRVLTADEVAELYRGINSGLIGYWRLDEVSGTSAADSSGNGNTGTMNGGLTGSNAVRGQLLSGLDFDGSNDRVTIANESNFDFDFDDPFTLAAWIYRETANSDDIVLGKNNWAPGYQFWLPSDGSPDCPGNGCLTIGILSPSDEGYAVSTSNGAISVNNWHHIVATYDGSNSVNGLKIYVDGTEKTDISTRWNDPPSGPALNNAPLLIGDMDDTGSGTGEFDGRIDEVRVYNRALSEQEIDRLYDMVVDPTCSKDNAINYDAVGNYYTRCQDTALLKSRQAAVGGACAKEGELDYLSASDAYRFCNGSNWIEIESRIVAMPTANLAHHWNLDESAGSAANPIGGNSATLVSSPVWQPSGGRIGGALEFDSALDRATITQITTTTPITFSFWMRRSANVAGNFIGILTEDDGSGIWHNPNQTSIAVYDTGGTERLNAGYIPTNVWKHVAVTDDGTTSRLYIDGMEVDTSSSRVDFNIRAFGNAFSGGYPYTGRLDDIRIYNRALSAAEIEDIVLTAP